MILRFVTLENAEMPIPGARYCTGQRAPRVGMRWDGSYGRYVSTGRPHEVAMTDSSAHSLGKMARNGEVVPFDTETAKAVGVAFKPIEYRDAATGWVLIPAAGAGARKPNKDDR